MCTFAHPRKILLHHDHHRAASLETRVCLNLHHQHIFYRHQKLVTLVGREVIVNNLVFIAISEHIDLALGAATSNL